MSDLADLVVEAVKESVGGSSKVGVAFSGGLDSSTLVAVAKKLTEVVAYSAYSSGSVDESRAGQAAGLLGVNLVSTTLDRDAVADELSKSGLPEAASPMDRSLWCLYSVVSRSAARHGAGVLLLGQLADELFGGYSKYQRTLKAAGEQAAKAQMDADVTSYGATGLARDRSACSRWLEPRFPFLDRKVLEFGLLLPVSYKIRGEERKAVLRQAAIWLGVPKEIAMAPKKAAQYSSGIQRLLS